MKRFWQFSITFVLGAVIAILVLFSRGIFSQTDTSEIYKGLGDAFFVPSAILCGFGWLVFASNGGAFDMLAYGFVKLGDLFRRDLTKVRYRTFYDYRKAQNEKKRGFGIFLIVGCFYLALAILFLILFEAV